MALFSFRHSVRTFSEKRCADQRAACLGQTDAHLNYITRKSAARTVIRERVSPTAGRDAEQAALKRKGRVCERFIIALPVEASGQQREDLVRAFCEAMTKGQAGYVAAIHDHRGNDQANPHAHIVMFDAFEKGSGRGRPRSVIGMARKRAVENAAALWAETHNRNMRDWGYGPESEISHLSYAQRGIERLPTIHEGAAGRAMASKGRPGTSKAAWRHVDEGHTRAEANRLITEINDAKETLDADTTNRLGRSNPHDTAARTIRSAKWRDADQRGGSDEARASPPFCRSGTDHYADPEDQRGTEEPGHALFLSRSRGPSAETKDPYLPTGFGLRNRWRIRRVFRELVMLRDTLRARILGSTSRKAITASLSLWSERGVRSRASQEDDARYPRKERSNVL